MPEYIRKRVLIGGTRSLSSVDSSEGIAEKV